MSKRGSSGFEPLGAVLRRATTIAVPKNAVPGAPVSARDWEAAVGSRIAARARPVKLERGILYVRTASSTWAQELSLLSNPILEQLRARGVEVEALRFRVGPVEAPERPPTRDEVRTSPPSAPLPPPLAAEIARVPDDELRQVIARAASKNLGWQRVREGKKSPARPAPAPAPEPPPPLAKTRQAGGRAPRSVAAENDLPARAEGRSSAGPRRSRGRA
ncbi:DUF721 domain-containing protein [Polyangium aurulentum]|uniref:DUF721 domain-containing protein n=1 Tax=Polyangium aurulentum TaxID=2567896 RepID=UPI0010AE8D61|nr:DUF721 domain-containing protein [Polyangium aurulentum]UQA61661.1 DUF721 domain-containing protein [Polyangium aurulentum]